MGHPRISGLVVVLAAFAQFPAGSAVSSVAIGDGLFARTNLVAWCIVPFDAKKRGPEERAAMLERLRFQGITNAGIVYNQHHGHGHLERFAELMSKMKPHLLALNLNGMTRDGEKIGKQILPVGQGELDLKLLRIIRDSGWRGPIGLLNHTDEDAEVRLQENLRGLRRLVAQLGDKSASTQPATAPSKYWTVEDPNEREKLPLYQVI